MGHKARIATTGMNSPAGLRNSHAIAIDLVHQAGAAKADLCLLSELFLHNDDGSACRAPEPVAKLKADLGELAQQYGMYVMASLPHWVDGTMYNAAILWDRSGHQSAPYFKIHPTEREITAGTKPGSEIGIVDLDFGRIGIAICFDIGWPTEWRLLQEAGVRAVVWLSAYDGGFPLQAYAWQHQYWVLSSVNGSHAKIIDPSGHIMAQSSRWDRLVLADVDLDRTVFHIDANWLKVPLVRGKYGDRVQMISYSEENYFTLETRDTTLSVAELVDEFGLETYRAYHARVTAIQDTHR